MSLHSAILTLLLLTISSQSSTAFLFSWGSPTHATKYSQQPPPEQQQYPALAYYQRLYQQPQFIDSTGAPIQIPAIPIQVPLQAQLAPASAVHNVQLVPCLCPVTQDMEHPESTQGRVPLSQNQQTNSQP